jgi:hypothetical protein
MPMTRIYTVKPYTVTGRTDMGNRYETDTRTYYAESKTMAIYLMQKSFPGHDFYFIEKTT